MEEIWPHPMTTATVPKERRIDNTKRYQMFVYTAIPDRLKAILRLYIYTALHMYMINRIWVLKQLCLQANGQA